MAFNCKGSRLVEPTEPELGDLLGRTRSRSQKDARVLSGAKGV